MLSYRFSHYVVIVRDESLPSGGDEKRAAVFSSTVLQPWNQDQGQPSSNKQGDANTDLHQLLDQKNEEIESLQQQLREKDQLISEIGATITSLREELMQVHIYIYHHTKEGTCCRSVL